MRPQGEDPCARLAYVFFLIAENKDRGRSRQSQIEMVRESVDNPFARDREVTLRWMLHIVDLVYRRPDARAHEIEQIVFDDCAVDERGQAVLKTPWPTE